MVTGGGVYLGGEVPVEDALAVEVLQATGDVQGQAQAHPPGEWRLALQELLQVPAVDVLRGSQRHRDVRPVSNFISLFAS